PSAAPSVDPSVAGQSFIGLLQSVEQLINEVAKNQMTEAKKAAKESRHKGFFKKQKKMRVYRKGRADE
ncbi:hypothetical protein Tco_0171695, partial [Tanacetum coccineum]